VLIVPRSRVLEFQPFTLPDAPHRSKEFPPSVAAVWPCAQSIEPSSLRCGRT
jgi:hypothetical protein